MPGRHLFLPPNIDAEADDNPDPSSPPGPVRPTHHSNQSKPVHPASQDEYSSSAVEDGQDDNDNSDGDDDPAIERITKEEFLQSARFLFAALPVTDYSTAP
jgi:hypothetical protein